jgi:hypothetical protein
MGRIRRIYLPLWVAWFSPLFVLPVWSFMTYQAFFTEKGRAELGIAGWMLATFVMAAVSTMLFLMGFRRLPAYIVEESES